MADSTVEPTDADLVAAALGGDRAAFAAIYDRYADRLHTMCVQMLGDRDEAADVCGEVFLVAFQRLGQLREPDRLRPWLSAIGRHEVFRRTKRRSRVDLVGEVKEMETWTEQAASAGEDVGGVDVATMVRAVRDAAVGLDDRDRMILELHLQGIEGQDLADAMGTSLSTSYQHVHRMRERMERSLGALLIARHGRASCDELDRLLGSWDGTFSVLWRKRVARHVDSCDVCERRRKAVPGALLGTAGASPLVVAPTSVRTRVLDGLPAGGADVGRGAALGAVDGEAWRSDGFPPAGEEPTRRFAGAALVVAALLVLAGIALLIASIGGDSSTVATVETPTPSVASSVPSTVPPASTASSPSTSEVVPTTSGRPTTTASRPTTTVAVVTSAPTTTAASTTTSSAPTTTGVPPTVKLSGPSVLYARAEDGSACSNQPFLASVSPGATSVSLSWSGSASGTVAMTRSRARSGWIATVHLADGTAGTVTFVAGADNSGSTGRSNVVTVSVSPCPVIG